MCFSAESEAEYQLLDPEGLTKRCGCDTRRYMARKKPHTAPGTCLFKLQEWCCCLGAKLGFILQSSNMSEDVDQIDSIASLKD